MRLILIVAGLIITASAILPLWFPTWFEPERDEYRWGPNDPRMPPAWRRYMNEEDE